MKVFLWEHIDGVFLVDEDIANVAKPYFISHPQRIVLLKTRVVIGMSNRELLSTINDDELQELVNQAVIHWKPILPYLKGFKENFIAAADIV